MGALCDFFLANSTHTSDLLQIPTHSPHISLSPPSLTFPKASIAVWFALLATIDHIIKSRLDDTEIGQYATINQSTVARGHSSESNLHSHSNDSKQYLNPFSRLLFGPRLRSTPTSGCCSVVSTEFPRIHTRHQRRADSRHHHVQQVEKTQWSQQRKQF